MANCFSVDSYTADVPFADAHIVNYLSVDGLRADSLFIDVPIANSIYADAHTANDTSADVEQCLHANSAYAESANRSVSSAVLKRAAAPKAGAAV